MNVVEEGALVEEAGARVCQGNDGDLFLAQNVKCDRLLERGTWVRGLLVVVEEEF